MTLPEQLAAGLAALRGGRWSEAEALLAPVVDDADLAEAADLADLRARALSWHAQALLELGRLREAETRCREALRLLRRLGDATGTAEVRRLQDRVVGLLAHDAEQAQRRQEQARIAATPLADLLLTAEGPAARAAVHVKKALALLDGGEVAEATPLARRALALAREGADVTWEVHAQVAVARCHPAEALDALVAAHRVAADADEFNLVAVIARAAEELQVALPSEPGPHHGRAAEDG
ncbi:MAG: hypothetical protein H6732_05260 [Alphaproteobacteria bacterium]|nr:hypothetical protein [Alphaproteobacteria bacterium]